RAPDERPRLPRHHLPRPGYRPDEAEYVQRRPADSHRGERRPRRFGDHRMTLRIFAVLCGLAVVGLPASAPRALAQRVLQPTGGAALTEGGKLVFLTDKRPVLLQLNINVDGQPIDQTWNGYIKKWFDYLDRDGDGKLSAQELRFAPRAEVMLQLMRQPQGLFFVNPNANANLRMADLGKNDDSQVELADFQRYYQKQRVRAIQV